MQPVDLVIHARWVIPIEPETAVLERYAVAIHAGRILEVGPAAALAMRYAPRELVRRDHHVLLPGLVNTHTHAAMSLLRGAVSRGPLERWLKEMVFPMENRWVSAEFVRAGTLLGIADMLRAGITCFADMYHFPEEVVRLAGELRLRIAVGLPIAEARTAWAENATDCLDRSAALWDSCKTDPWARLYFAPHAPYSVSEPTMQRLRRMVDQLDAPIAMHLHETAGELREFTAAHGIRPLAWLERLGLLRPGFTAIHATHFDAADIELAARSGIAVAHCPTSNLRLGCGVAPVAQMLDRGVNVTLGTDGPASAGRLDILGEARLAALLSHGLHPQAAGISGLAALRLATLNGAQSLGLAHDIGSIVAGKAADLICVDADDPVVGQPQAIGEALVFDGSAHRVTDVWVGGRAQLRDGELCAIDIERINDGARQWAARMGLGATP
jgi:5-methylthioadenosine/S-adenosylhomocysteine deaminase